MIDRVLLWLGAGAICAGVGVGMLAGVGVAHATSESDGDGGAKTSQSTKPDESKQDSSHSGSFAAARAGAGFGHDAVKAIKAAVDDAGSRVARSAKTAAVSDAARTPTRPQPGRRIAELVNDVVSTVAPTPDRKVLIERTRTRVETTLTNLERSVPLEKSPDFRAVRNVREQAEQADQAEQPVQADQLVQPTRQTTTLTQALSQPSVAASAPSIDVPPAVSAIGTAVFGLISFAESVFEGPPKALPGSGVTVKRSTLAIGDQEVPADWYFPEGYDPDSDTPPARIIYLQHGFLARGVFYDYTASYLAKETNSIVVAPTLTSNLFATDGMWLGGDQMHRAAADLFNDDNTALLQSAKAAGYTQDELPQDVVLVGHSLGGGFVLDTARYMVENQRNGESTYYRLDGVLMMDGVSFTDPVPILAQIPTDIPVYNLSSTPNFWNLFGTMDHALAEVRGDQFTGVQQLGGWHSDSMIGGNPLVQFGAYLLTGFPLPSNVAGSQILLAGWADDMFDADQASGFYGAPGSRIVVPTGVGPSIGLVQPTPGLIATFGRELIAFSFTLFGRINFATDVPAPQETGVLQEISA